MNRMLTIRREIIVAICLAEFGLIGRLARAADVDSGEKVYKRTLLSTVWIRVPTDRINDGGKILIRLMEGTGSLIDLKYRLVLTNYHVVRDHDKAYVYFPIMKKNGDFVAEREVYQREGARINGTVIDRDPKRDLAIIQLERIPEGAKALTLAPESPSPGQRLHSIGNPGASDALWVYTQGTVRQVYHRHIKTGGGNGMLPFEIDARIVETQSPVNRGDSGGPVVNDHGQLVAVTQGHLNDNQARLVSIFIDVSEVRGFLKSVFKNKKVPLPPTLAKEVTEKPKSEAAANTRKVSETKGDAAEKAEQEASLKLRLAKMLARDGFADKARRRYEEIVEKYPKTKSAAEARKLLDK